MRDTFASGAFDLQPIGFEDLPGYEADEMAAFWRPFLASCRAVVDDAPELRKAVPPAERFRQICAQALSMREAASEGDIRGFIERHFTPHLITPISVEQRAFFTAYYRPVIRASVHRTQEFREPLLARPDNLVTLSPNETSPELTGLSSASREVDGSLRPFPTRAQIDAGALGANARPVAFVKDAIEAFMIHVQGSARLVLEDGQALDLTYAGRNGRPYTSIGKVLIERGDISLADMSLDRLKTWVRENGQEPGEAGRNLLHANQSFVFFSVQAAEAPSVGPIGAAGVPLTTRRSIATDRSIWPYGLPFWIQAEIPWETGVETPFNRLMIGQDTGTAIVGPARADLFFGDGDEAGRLAGGVRHFGRMYVLLPRDDAQ
jgi:membrane-bound lytic murein transglycosylase A